MVSKLIWGSRVKIQRIPQKCQIARGRPPYESLGELNINFSKGPHAIKKTFSGSAATLTTMDSDNSLHPVNTDIVRKYYTKDLLI